MSGRDFLSQGPQVIYRPVLKALCTDTAPSDTAPQTFLYSVNINTDIITYIYWGCRTYFKVNTQVYKYV